MNAQYSLINGFCVANQLLRVRVMNSLKDLCTAPCHFSLYIFITYLGASNLHHWSLYL